MESSSMVSPPKFRQFVFMLVFVNRVSEQNEIKDKKEEKVL
jgi:hypothetical protein